MIYELRAICYILDRPGDKLMRFLHFSSRKFTASRRSKIEQHRHIILWPSLLCQQMKSLWLVSLFAGQLCLSFCLKSQNAPPRQAPTLWESVPKSPIIVAGPDKETKPDYEKINGPFGKTLDKVFLSVFRTKMADKVGVDSSLPKDDYKGLMELSSALNARYNDRTKVQKIAQDVLRALFPSWLPRQYAILFSRPFPEFSARMNAWATRVGGTWLMGECEINDIEIDGKVYKDQGLLVKRCRFLEESGCASVCVNACKIPTQNFFIEDMGLPLTMTPDYETHECQFSFGRLPTKEEELEAKTTPCLSRCPTSGGMKKWHDGSIDSVKVQEGESACHFMENDAEIEV